MQIDESVVSAVTGHMNGDHADDNLLIARAFGFPAATGATMSGLDAHRGVWRVTDAAGEHEVTVPWPGGEVTERPQLRREIVMIYREACRRLGVSAREEHAPAADAAPHGASPHGASPHGASPHGEGSPLSEGGAGFARRLREATWGDHGDSEGATFMTDVMRGRGSVADYTALVVQHYVMYQALEEVSQRLIEHPVLAALHPASLLRVAALERDLQHLQGDGWREGIAAVPATAEYARRIREVADEGWLAGIVAHHYTRYLGDLSGGQVIARRVTTQFGFDDAGAAFYDFAGLGDLDAFKNRYREVLDEYGDTLSEAERQRMLDEVRAAYRHNTAVFIDLDRARLAV
ncbi:biliverdin-producing heme oxygenase [Microbacterium sp. NPDC058342]|uniref:biliverdin-producing heme oxygenase n=1 Tax=Microbacterium sp. NPDC058342 TaxID=3346454 RepID=UPI00365BBEA4